MLQSIKQLCGNKLGASDGDIGQVKDFYFDDQSWVVRYLVADTGTWLTSRQVLLSPHAFGGLHQMGKILTVNLTRKQIEDSPPIEWHKPVSRQYEEEYHRYYGWPFYWLGDGLWGMSGFPILESPAKPFAGERDSVVGSKPKNPDAHLRSTQAVNGYHLQASDGITGHVCDFVMDSKSWAINQLIIKTGHRFTGNEVVIPVNTVERISYDDSTVFVKLTKAEVEKSPAHDLSPFRVSGFTPPEGTSHSKSKMTAT
jgi:sporulation protein YlmC with PRC-barrel domain